MSVTAQGKRYADNHPSGAMGGHTLQTTSSTASILPNNKNKPTKDHWSDYETKLLLSYANKCLGKRGDKVVFRPEKMHAFWKNIVATQGKDTPAATRINERTDKNLASKWASCLKANVYKAAVALVLKAKDTATVSVEDIETALKRPRETEEAPEPEKKAPEADTVAEDAHDDPQGAAVAPPSSTGRLPTPDMLKGWLRIALVGCSREEIERKTMKSLSIEGEKYFGLDEDTLTPMKDTIAQLAATFAHAS